jgi:hypothetical protein
MLTARYHVIIKHHGPAIAADAEPWDKEID